MKYLYDKKIDKSLLTDGFTLSKVVREKVIDKYFNDLDKGERKDIRIKIFDDKYQANLVMVNSKDRDDLYQIRYGSSTEICMKLNDIFNLFYPEEFLEIYFDENNLEFVFFPMIRSLIESKDRFIKYIGSKDSLEKNRYKKSYKIIWLMSLLKILSNPDFSNLVDEAYSIYNSISDRLDLQKEFVLKNKEVFSKHVLRKKFLEAPLIALTNTEFINYDKTNERIIINENLNESLSPKNIEEINELLEIKLNQYIELRNVDDMDENEKTMNNNNLIEYLKGHLESNGLIYSKDLLSTIYLSMRTKPLILLAGISGTGKSRFVKGLAEACGSNTENGRYRMISVRPDWSDSSDLLGFCDINGSFNPGPLTEFVYDACCDDMPYFLCLDEMNLARVEHYFSDVLSVLETRAWDNGKVVTDKLLYKEMFGRDNDALEKYSQLHIPENLYIFGTVNMDESTYPFSNKVLDRANTIEFNHVNFSIDKFDSEEVEDKVVGNGMFASRYLSIKDCFSNMEILSKVNDNLTEINEVLNQTNFKFAYRIRDEIAYFMMYALEDGFMKFDDAFDLCIYQKILPKIKGSQFDVKEVITTLFKLFIANKSINFDDRSNRAFESMRDELKKTGKKVKYEKSAEKLVGLMRTFEVDGYASFWN